MNGIRILILLMVANLIVIFLMVANLIVAQFVYNREHKILFLKLKIRGIHHCSMLLA